MDLLLLEQRFAGSGTEMVSNEASPLRGEFDLCRDRLFHLARALNVERPESFSLRTLVVYKCKKRLHAAHFLALV